MKKGLLLPLLCVFSMIIIACDGTKTEVSDPKTGKATVMGKTFVPADSGVSVRITGGGPGTLGIGVGGVGIGLGSGLQMDLDSDPDRFVIKLSFNNKMMEKEVSSEKYSKIELGAELIVTYREKRWVDKDGQVIKSVYWIEKIE